MSKVQIQIDAVRKIYQMGTETVYALRDISFRVFQNEYMAIMGPSGSGKSTLLNILGCLDTPSKGRYILDGEAVSEMKGDALADVRNRKIGFCFSDIQSAQSGNGSTECGVAADLRGSVQTPP